MRLLAIVLTAAWALAGCGEQVPPTITPRPTLTPTPFSTQLPFVPTGIPLGFEQNPLPIALVALDRETAEADAEALQAEIAQRGDVAITWQFVARTADALALLCSGEGGAWVDALGYARAMAQGCGAPALAVPSEAGVVLIARTIESNALADGVQGVFCRLGFEDWYTWVLPSLVLRSERVPLGDIREVRTFASRDEWLKAVRDGTCDMTGMEASTYQTFVDVGDTVAERMRLNTRTAPTLSRVLFLPITLPLAKRDALIQALLDSARTPSNSDAEASIARAFWGDGVRRYDARDWADFDTFLRVTGIDFAALGE